MKNTPSVWIFTSLLSGLVPTYALAVSDSVALPAVAADSMQLEDLQVPVSWRLTRAKFDHMGNASETESYMENWSIELDENGGLFLRSRRARVPVLVARKGGEGAPARMTVDKVDLALLVGLIRDRSMMPEPSNSNESITLDLGSGMLKQLELKLNALKDEHLSLWLKIGKPQNSQL